MLYVLHTNSCLECSGTIANVTSLPPQKKKQAEHECSRIRSFLDIKAKSEAISMISDKLASSM